MARASFGMHPGRVLREEFMEPAGVDAETLARALDVEPARIAMLVSGAAPVSCDTALRLARCFRTTANFWLGLQTAHDLDTARAEHGAEIATRVQPIGLALAT
jgi:addiction module HigA family antidote